MDLSFSRFATGTELSVLPPDLAVLMVGVAARQAASATAVRQARIVRSDAEALLLQPLDGAFNGPVACALLRWKDE